MNIASEWLFQNWKAVAIVSSLILCLAAAAVLRFGRGRNNLSLGLVLVAFGLGLLAMFLGNREFASPFVRWLLLAPTVVLSVLFIGKAIKQWRRKELQ